MKRSYLVILSLIIFYHPSAHCGLGDFIGNFGRDLATGAKQLVKAAGNIVTLNQCTDYEWEQERKARKEKDTELEATKRNVAIEIEQYRVGIKQKFKEDRKLFLEQSMEEIRTKLNQLNQIISLQKDLLACLNVRIEDLGILEESLRNTEAMQNVIRKIDIRHKNLSNPDDLRSAFKAASGLNFDNTRKLMNAALQSSYSPEQLGDIKKSIQSQVESSIKLREKLLVDYQLASKEIEFLKEEGK